MKQTSDVAKGAASSTYDPVVTGTLEYTVEPFKSALATEVARPEFTVIDAPLLPKQFFEFVATDGMTQMP